VDDDIRTSLAALAPKLRRFALALTGSAADADDLVQSACERALARSAQLREAERVDGWLYGIMRHLWFDETRARRVRRHDDLDDADALIAERVFDLAQPSLAQQGRERPHEIGVHGQIALGH